MTSCFMSRSPRAAYNPAFILVLGGFEKVMRQSWPISWRTRAIDEVQMESVGCYEFIAQAIKSFDTPTAEKALASAGIV